MGFQGISRDFKGFEGFHWISFDLKVFHSMAYQVHQEFQDISKDFPSRHINISRVFRLFKVSQGFQGTLLMINGLMDFKGLQAISWDFKGFHLELQS